MAVRGHCILTIFDSVFAFLFRVVIGLIVILVNSIFIGPRTDNVQKFLSPYPHYCLWE